MGTGHWFCRPAAAGQDADRAAGAGALDRQVQGPQRRRDTEGRNESLLGKHLLQRVEDFGGRRGGQTSQSLDETFAIDCSQLIQGHES